MQMLRFRYYKLNFGKHSKYICTTTHMLTLATGSYTLTRLYKQCRRKALNNETWETLCEIIVSSLSLSSVMDVIIHNSFYKVIYIFFIHSVSSCPQWRREIMNLTLPR